MELPTPREIELETLLRQRDAQLAELTDEVAHLRQYLPNQPTPNITDPISLPPPFVSRLLPLINSRSSPATSSSDTVTAALTQRVKILQEENDELYEILKSGETGRLKEDVRSLRRASQKLETALREAHQVIESLSEELEKSQATVLAYGRLSDNSTDSRTHSESPVMRTHHPLPPHPHASANGSGGGKPPPTAPRAHKKPRLSEGPPPSTANPPHSRGGRSRGESARRHDTPEHAQTGSVERQRKMDVDADDRRGARSPLVEAGRDRDFERDREREKERSSDRDRNRERPRADRDRDRHRERDRDRDRTREHDRSSKRNGAYGVPASGGSTGGGGGRDSGGGRRPRRGSNANSYSSADRTLAERMGLGL
ncbi:hypothetical protein BDY19DRAFT_138948 [Irpex rosettiformis]|uniref:Uncharacterized protein n=1 Tax=Irpex rosettiformis TaxID=378272 RepID=A0ACB8U4X2_9APHY|nr:hypothetical protein BDY19DRAFT_138948 [Irpex rosettiformis]